MAAQRYAWLWHSSLLFTEPAVVWPGENPVAPRGSCVSELGPVALRNPGTPPALLLIYEGAEVPLEAAAPQILTTLGRAFWLPDVFEDGVSLLVFQGILFFLGIAALLRKETWGLGTIPIPRFGH